MTLVVFERKRQIKWIDTLCRIDTHIEVAPSDRIDERFVFVFRIYDDHIMTEHERSEYLELDGKRFTSS